MLSQRFSQSVGLSSLGNQDEETSATRGAEMVTNSVTVLSKYGCHGYNGDQNFISPYNVNQFSSEGYFFCNSFVYFFFSALLFVVIHP